MVDRGPSSSRDPSCAHAAEAERECTRGERRADAEQWPMTSGSGGSRSRGSVAADLDPVAARALPHVDALDSLRAIAVIGVLAYHQAPGRVPGGWLGVSIFFTLSGFLVAGLLLAERERSGRVALGRFWSRRIRRLLPASMVAIGMAFVVSSAQGGVGPSFANDVRAAVLNVANWRFIASGAAYADAGAHPSPVQHYWSLAIEEQFYLVLPLVVVLCLSRRRIFKAVLSMTVAVSLVLQRTLVGVDRVYFGTDTRASELALGVSLAVAWPWIRDVLRGSRWFADAVGFTALAATAVLFATVDLDAHVVGSGALLAVTVLWVGLVIGAVVGPRFGRLLSIPVLPGIGRISYGIYLYHWPVYLLLTPSRTGISGLGLFGVRAMVTVALAGLSAWALELPIRRSEWRTRPALALAATAVVIVVAVSVVIPSRSTQTITLAGATLVTAPEVTAPEVPPTVTTAAPERPPSNAVTPAPADAADASARSLRRCRRPAVGCPACSSWETRPSPTWARRCSSTPPPPAAPRCSCSGARAVPSCPMRSPSSAPGSSSSPRAATCSTQLRTSRCVNASTPSW